MTKFTMKRFPDCDPDNPDWPGVFSVDAKTYGIGAFCYDTDDRDLPYILFRHPNKDGKVEVGSLPLEGKGWTFDGDRDKPNISPSILYRIQLDGQWVEIFHGFIRNGVLEVL